MKTQQGLLNERAKEIKSDDFPPITESIRSIKLITNIKTPYIGFDYESFLWIKYQDDPKGLERYMSDGLIKVARTIIFSPRNSESLSESVKILKVRHENLEDCGSERLLTESKRICELPGWKTAKTLLNQEIKRRRERMDLDQKLITAILKLFDEKQNTESGLSKDDRDVLDLIEQL